MYKREDTLKVKKELKKQGYIVVWKFLENKNGQLDSPVYSSVKWKIGQVHTSDRTSASWTAIEISNKWVNQGFYTYLTRQDAMRNPYNGKLHRLLAYPQDFVCASGCYALFHKLILLAPKKPVPKNLLPVVKKPVVKKIVKAVKKVIKKKTVKKVAKKVIKKKVKK